MRRGAWLLCFGVCSFGGEVGACPGFQAPGVIARGGEQRQQHLASVLTERRSHFHALWRDAAPDRRSAARRLLGERLAGSDLHRPQPDLVLLALVSRALRGEDAEVLEHDPLARLADRLDLTSSPVAVPGDGEESVPVTIMVRLLEGLRAGDAFDGTLELSILWIAPDGSETHGRHEPFTFKAFTQGFPMYLRTPPGARGLWHLVPVLEKGARRVRGWPAPVEAIHGLEQRLSELPTELGGTGRLSN